MEEVVLCQAWCDVSENITGNAMKSMGFWLKGSKKCKTSETTSGSAQGGLNLNDEADGSGEEVREVKPIRRDRAKKKAFASSRFKYSSVAGGGLVNLVTDKWKSQVGWLRKNEGKTTILYRLYESGIGYLGKRESRGSGVEKTGT
nr:hypothetical protein [Tanacetum cinerariifolium]